MTTLCGLANRANITFLALEYDDFNNWSRWPQFRNACEAHNIGAALWVTRGSGIATLPQDVDFFIAEHEGMDDYNGIVAGLPNMPDRPHAIISNLDFADGSDYNPENYPFGLNDTELEEWRESRRVARARVLIDNGFDLIAECYMGDNPRATPDELRFRATQLGWKWKEVQMGYGCWNKPREEYLAEFLDELGHWSYVAENFLR